jgi:signal transduction histidine kinase
METNASPRWHYLYYMLAAFDVATVLLTLYLSLRIMHIYTESVAVNQIWARRLDAYSHLGQLAIAVNAPGNDVFDTHNVTRELAKLHEALRSFATQIATQRQELVANLGETHASPILMYFTEVETAMEEMTREAELIFSYFAQQQAEKAGQRMATMDRKYATLNTALARLRAHVGEIQQAEFAKQIAAAHALQRFEYVIAGCILLMVGGATIYGRRLALQIAHDEEARRQSAAALQQALDELERRVDERTAELAASNATLRTEITERRRVEEALSILSRQLLETQEQERRHLARELHDELGQTLTALRLSVEAQAQSPTPSSARLAQSLAMIDTLLQKVRTLSIDLRPAVLDDLGLVAALGWYVARQAELVGFTAHLKTEALEPRPDSLLETVCFRVVQEALTNIARHAQAQNVWIELRQCDAQTVSLSVRDDGIGFQVNSSQERTIQGSSLGLLGMRERVALVGGTLELRSTPGQGTEIRVRIPLRRAALAS